MKSWKTRLLMVFTMLALILAASVPGMASIEVECESDEGDTCETYVYEENLSEDDTLLEDEADEDLFAVEDPFAVETAEDCYPFCGLEWWPW